MLARRRAFGGGWQLQLAEVNKARDYPQRFRCDTVDSSIVVGSFLRSGDYNVIERPMHLEMRYMRCCDNRYRADQPADGPISMGAAHVCVKYIRTEALNDVADSQKFSRPTAEVSGEPLGSLQPRLIG